MTVARFLLGLPLALATVVPLVLAARRVRRRFLPDWAGSEAVLVDLIVVLSALTLIGEAIGTVGWFSLGPLVGVSVVVGLATWFLLRRGRDPVVDADREVGPVEVGVAGWVAIGAGLALTFGTWIGRTTVGLAQGITSTDSIWYHLPIANRFVQTGGVFRIQPLDGDSVTAYFPATSSLLHAMGFLWFDSDLVSVVVNLGWLAAGLLAAWCIGRPFRIAPLTLAAAAILFASPGMVETQSAGALTDVVGVALLLAMVALILRPSAGHRPPAQDVVAALAGGLATGMKFTFLFPVVCLGLVLCITAPAGLRLRRSLLVLAAGLASGGYWYIRNVILTGNPLPALDVGFGPVRLRAVEGVAHATSVSSLLFDGPTWRKHFLPGFRDAYGPAWVVVLALVGFGLVGGVVWGRSREIRLLGAAGVLSAVAFIFTPQYLFGGMFFATNLRYAAPAVVLGLVLAVLLLRGWAPWAGPGVGLVLVATQLDPTSWPFGVGGPSFFSPIGRGPAERGALAVAVIGVLATGSVLVWRRRPEVRAWALRLVWAIPLVLVLGLAGVHGRYYRGRYAAFDPFPEGYAWASEIHDAHLGLYGAYLVTKYPFAGADRSNSVVYLSVPTARGGFRPPTTCVEWAEILRRQHLDYVLVLARPGFSEEETRWTRIQPGARLGHTFPMSSTDALVLRAYHLTEEATPSACRS